LQRVLILAYDFSPYVSIGAQRPESWLRHFPDLGIDTTVVTRHWNDNTKTSIDYIRPSAKQAIETTELSNLARVVRVPFQPNFRDKIIIKYGLNRFVFFRRILSILFSVGKFFSLKIDDTASIYSAADEYLSKNKVDVIIATGEPFILFKHANKLSARHQIPWVADFRDCWSVSPMRSNGGIISRFVNKIFRGIEQKVVSSASFITTPSPSYKYLLEKIHPGKDVEVVYNGYNADVFEEIGNVNADEDVFEIAYAGILYEHQQLEMFLDGLKLFLDKVDRSKVRVIFYGIAFYDDMTSRILNYDTSLNELIVITERFSYPEVMKKLKKADVLLLLSNEGANWLNAKVFDYIALERPVLLVKNDKGILRDILNRCETGFIASSSVEVSNHLQFICQNYFVERKAFPAPVNYDFFSRSNQAMIFVNLLKQKIKIN
jgi:glycosyltransferase involved in cell wall biosynthesis